jgi:hypothetical protein
MSIYERFIKDKNYSEESKRVIQETVDNLLKNLDGINHPGMLLGKIQSGKTRTFIGIIALSFDKGYDVCIVLTKGTVALSEQTYRRLSSEFSTFSEDDEIQVYDIMKMPKLTPFLMEEKLIFVVKKQRDNLSRTENLFSQYPNLLNKKVLIIDDEADFGGIGFTRDKKAQDDVVINVLASQIDSLRFLLKSNHSFLQVTATPYSLYLQPKGEFTLNSFVHQPIKPQFTSLVPIHDAYVGGVQYFEESLDPDSIFYYLHIDVLKKEFEVLENKNAKYLTNILTTPNLSVLRKSILNFLVGGAIRMIQEEKNNRKYKCSFILHTSVGNEKHNWQIDLVEKLLDSLKDKSQKNDANFTELIRESYLDISESVKVNRETPPSFEVLLAKVQNNLSKGYCSVKVINSENDISVNLDNNGQLKLDNPYNIFIGGQILDRGLTIENLIGFFYGRDPKEFQMDTVLQHSRMYGARSRNDMSVTRFYTSTRIYQAMKKMHEFDSSLRSAFERGLKNGDDGVVFVFVDGDSDIKPCAPDKILISNTVTISSGSRTLPFGFQTKAKTHIQKNIDKIDDLIEKSSGGNINKPFLIDLSDVKEIITLIAETYEYSDTYDNKDLDWDHTTFVALMDRHLIDSKNQQTQAKIYVYCKKNRDISRYKKGEGSFSDAPDDGRTDLKIARETAKDLPCLILLKQNGKKEKGWRDAEFYWPILISPQVTKPAVYASKIKV